MMTENQFMNQKAYSTAITVLKEIKASGVIDESDFKKAESALRAKYNPVILYTNLI